MITKPQEDKYIYADGVDYSKTPDSSVWGTEEDLTAKILSESGLSGKWLNLCAGDGRFNNKLLENVDEVLAVDIDESALEKLVRITPDDLRSKLSTKKLNVVETFPFNNESFDGIFCVGTLHLFPKEVFKKILGELNRVLKQNGRLIFDFAVDIKRRYPDGSLWVVENEPSYTFAEAKEFLQDSMSGFDFEILTDIATPEDVTLNGRTYTFSCNLLLVKASKKPNIA